MSIYVLKIYVNLCVKNTCQLMCVSGYLFVLKVIHVF